MSNNNGTATLAVPESNGIAVRQSDGNRYMPVLPVDDMLRRKAELARYRSEILADGVDYGVIPGTGDKPALFKAGAEKLCQFFGLTVQFEILERTEDWTGEQHGDEPLFAYTYRCHLSRDGYHIASADGHANSRETKYRYRRCERKCPQCGKAAIIKGSEQYGGGYVCWKKKDGCGAKFGDNDPAIVNQVSGRVANIDVADSVNTLMKMSQKRALVAATLIAVGASEYFTQDIEDFSHTEAPEPPAATETARPVERPAPPANGAEAAPERPEPATAEMLAECERLRALAVSTGFRVMKRGSEPVMPVEAKPGTPAPMVAKKIAAYTEWLKHHPAPAPEAVEGEVVQDAERVLGLCDRFNGDPTFRAFIGAAEVRNLRLETDADLSAFESAYSELMDYPINTDEFQEGDWEEVCKLVSEGSLKW